MTELTKKQKYRLRKAAENKRYEQYQKDLGLVKVTNWCPNYAATELKELMAIICEFHLEQGKFHRKLFPSMYREFSTGQVGSKSLSEIKKKGR